MVGARACGDGTDQMYNDIEYVACSSGSEEPPAMFHRPFLVQCDSRRCLAYYHRDGKWHNFENGAELPDFVKVIDED